MVSSSPPPPFQGGIYTARPTQSPHLNLATSADELILSWVVPSVEFGLQQNYDLTTTNWTGVTTTPTLNLTNLKNQVTLPLQAGESFYRLKMP